MRLVVAVVAALGCSAGATRPTTGGGATDCASLRPRVEQLYRADAEARDRARGGAAAGSGAAAQLAEAVADNTAMVMADCAREPARVTGCVPQVTSAAELERRCLIPLDEEGTEGDRLAH